MKNINWSLFVLVSALLLGSCGNGTAVESTSAPAQTTAAVTAAPETTAAAETISPDGSMYAELSSGMPAAFEASDGWSNGSMFNVTWRADNVTFNDGKMQLTIDKDPKPKGGVPYSGGEFRSKDFYGYGLYEVSMKAIRNDGVVSSFFTYTGPSDNNPWDEIDVEILGKDTTQVQFNYFTDGKGGHEYMYELGFDASEDFHVYAFDWQEDSITWYVDGVEAHKAEKRIPVTPGKIMMNAWCGTGVDGWLNAFNDSSLPVSAEYQWVKYTPAG
ncbi:MAG: glycoside hydrolase family 16 protein [Ruminiclostridium sp.]|nr:glycoside hydrolase family 16 protein [Ruminiclostridium sp.]